MVEQTIRIQNTVGIHARPASLLIDTAKQFDSAVTIRKDGRTSDCKSIFTLLKLKGKLGDELTITCEGTDEQACLRALVHLIETRFGEE